MINIRFCFLYPILSKIENIMNGSNNNTNFVSLPETTLEL